MARSIGILIITILLSFASGQLAAQKASKSFQDQVKELIENLKAAENAHAINNRKISHIPSHSKEKSLLQNTYNTQDPNL